MLQRKTLTSWIVLIVAMMAFGASQATADVGIRELTLARHDVFTELTVRTPGRILCNHFTEEPKFGKPFRVVLDFCGAVHELDRKIFEDLPPGVVTRIRTSQYATTPQNVVRVVLDLTHEVTYKVAADENAIRISLVAPEEPDFPIWSSSGKTEQPADDRPAVMASAKQPVPPPTEQESTPGAEEQPVVEDQSPTQWPARLEVVYGPYLEESPTYSATKADEKPPLVQHDEAEAAEQQNSEPEKPSLTTAPGSEWSASSDLATDDGSPQEQTAAIESSEQIAPSEESIEETMPEVAMEPLEGATGETPASGVNEPAEEKEKQSLITRLRSKFFGSPDEEKLAADQPVDTQSLGRIRALAALTEDQAEESAPEVEGAPPRRIDRAELESKIASVDPSIVPAGTAYADAERQGENIPAIDGMGTPVDEEPEREEVEYDRAGRRDPFDPLVEGQRSGLWTAALPRVDALRLVGILEDFDGSLALFEDMEGYGYILREGDPVKNGYLKTITDDRVVFEVDDYGWVHTLVLELRDESSTAGFGYAKDLLEE